MQIAYSGWSYREFAPVGESDFISFNLEQLHAGTGKPSGTTGAGRVAAAHAQGFIRRSGTLSDACAGPIRCGARRGFMENC